MRSPFPGMDPYLEHPALWPDIHNRLIAAIADTLAEEVAPRYYIGLERRAYLLKPDDIVFIGRPDIAFVPHERPTRLSKLPLADVAVLNVNVPMKEEVLDYMQAAVPPLSEKDIEWAKGLLLDERSAR